MKNSKLKSWSMTSSALALGLNLLSACGTEIGNGRKAPEIPDTSKNGNTTTAPDDSTSEDAPGSDVKPLPSEFEYLFIACGSPIPDLTATSYLESIDSSSLSVTVPSSGSWTLANSTESYLIQKDTNASSPHAIKSSSVTLGTQTCSQVTTVLNGSETEKTIQYSDNYKTIWTIDGTSKVTNIKVLDPSGATVKNWTSQ